MLSLNSIYPKIKPKLQFITSQKLYLEMIMKLHKIFSPWLWQNILSWMCSWPFSSPSTAKDFISCLMEKDPEKRFTCDQALEHPWWETNRRHTAPQPDKHREPHISLWFNSSMTQIARLTHLSWRACSPTVICHHGSEPQTHLCSAPPALREKSAE